MVSYLDAVVAVNGMRVLLFVLHVCMLRECDGARLTAMLVFDISNIMLEKCEYECTKIICRTCGRL